MNGSVPLAIAMLTMVIAVSAVYIGVQLGIGNKLEAQRNELLNESLELQKTNTWVQEHNGTEYRAMLRQQTAMYETMASPSDNNPAIAE